MSGTYKTATAGRDDDVGVSDDTTEPEVLTPPFDTKIAIAVRDDLETWQRLNVAAFLASGIAAECPQLVGEPYADADGTPYLRIFGMPVLVFEASKEVLTAARERAVRRSLPLAVYTSDMFRTGHDRANRDVVRAVPGADLDVVGLALHGPKNAVDKVVKGARLHP
jgi:hypothetical protein